MWRNRGEESGEKSSRRNHEGEQMKEKPWRGNHGGESMEEKSLRRKHGGEVIEEKADFQNSLQLPAETVLKIASLEAEGPRRRPGGLQETSRRHPGGVQETPRRSPEAARGQEWSLMKNMLEP